MKYKAIPELTERAIARFYRQIALSDDCWLWQAAKDSDGYGVFWLPAGNFKAHRIAYCIDHKADPAESLVYHTCLRNDCVRPSHLYIPVERPDRKNEVPDHIVDEVAGLLGLLKQNDIARRYKLSETTVSRIKQRTHATK